MIEKYTVSELINHCQQAIEKADKNESNISQEILSMQGMSGTKTRHLYNNICNLKNANYLEIGTWQGSSFVSSNYKNNLNSIVIDNWSQFNGPKDQFIENVKTFCPETKYHYIENDCFAIDLKQITDISESIDIYLYDGEHSQESQKKALTYFYPVLSKYSIVIIDDFCADSVWKGTDEGLEEAGLIVHTKITRECNQTTGGDQTYWNGLGLFVCERTK